MRKRLLFHAGVGILLSFQSCITENKSTKNISTPEENAHVIQDTLAYHVEIFQEISPHFSGNEAGLDTTHYTARYPVFTAEIDTLVREAIFVDGEETAGQVAESFLGGFNEYAEEQIESGNPFHAWFKNQNCDVVLNIPGFLSLKNTISDYMGGAHGMDVELWSNYDIQNRRKLSLTDLIRDPVALRQITEIHFRKHEELSDTSSYEGAYFFDNDTFSLADNFGLTTEGLLFHYNPYEIKSYAEGPTTLVIPYSALEDTMTERGKAVVKGINNQ